MVRRAMGAAQRLDRTPGTSAASGVMTAAAAKSSSGNIGDSLDRLRRVIGSRPPDPNEAQFHTVVQRPAVRAKRQGMAIKAASQSGAASQPATPLGRALVLTGVFFGRTLASRSKMAWSEKTMVSGCPTWT